MGREFYNYSTQLLLLYHSPTSPKRSLKAPTYPTHRPPPTPLFQYTPLSILPLYHSLPLSHYFTQQLPTLSSSPIAVPPPPLIFLHSPTSHSPSLPLHPSPSFSLSRKPSLPLFSYPILPLSSPPLSPTLPLSHSLIIWVLPTFKFLLFMYLTI